MASKNDDKSTGIALSEENQQVAMLEGYDLQGLMADVGLGSEGLSSEDIAIPYIGILQGLSPQVTEGKEGYIEGARPSMFFNNVTGEIYEGRKKGIIVVPAYYRKQWLVWMDRDSGGGLVDVYGDDSILTDCVKNEKGQWVVKDNTKLVVFETAQHFCLRLNLDTMETERVVISLKSTGLKANRKFNHAITSAKIPGHPNVSAPRFMFAYNVTTFLEEKNGNSWWSPEFARLKDPVSRAVYDEAKAYYELVKSGNIKLAEEPGPDHSTSGGSQNESGQGVSDDEIPF
jgi:hypothetical protein